MMERGADAHPEAACSAADGVTPVESTLIHTIAITLTSTCARYRPTSVGPKRRKEAGLTPRVLTEIVITRD